MPRSRNTEEIEIELERRSPAKPEPELETYLAAQALISLLNDQIHSYGNPGAMAPSQRRQRKSPGGQNS